MRTRRVPDDPVTLAHFKKPRIGIESSTVPNIAEVFGYLFVNGAYVTAIETKANDYTRYHILAKVDLSNEPKRLRQ